MTRLGPLGGLVLSLCLVLAGCSAREAAFGPALGPDGGPWVTALGQAHPLAGRIWSPGRAAFVEPEALLAELARADVLILGEKHDNADHHRIQAWALAAFIERGRHPAVAFEMLTTDQSEALRDYLARHPRDAAGLGAAIAWEARGWPDWSQYQPIAQAALDAGAPLLPADVPRPTLKAVMKEGARALGAEAERRMALAEPVPARMDRAMQRQIAEAHCDQLPASMIAPMTTAMRVRDAHMADVLIQGAALAGRDSAVLITGKGHARVDYGVPFHLRRLAPGKTVVSLAPLEVSEDETDPRAYAARFSAEALPFDYVWFTPRPEREPACERFADQLRRAKERHERERAPK